MLGEIGISELIVVVLVVVAMMYPTLSRTTDDSGRRNGARAARFPYSQAFWPLTIFAFVALAAFTTTIIVVALLSR